jgi:hypothetical protein
LVIASRARMGAGDQRFRAPKWDWFTSWYRVPPPPGARKI